MTTAARGLVVVVAVAGALALPGCDLIAGTAACASAADCPSSLPVCRASTCAARCLVDDDCPDDRPLCSTSGACLVASEGEGAEGEGAGGEGEGAAGEGEGAEGEGEGEGVVDVAEIDMDNAASHLLAEFIGGEAAEARVACSSLVCMVVYRDDRVTPEEGDIFGAVAPVGAAGPTLPFAVVVGPGDQGHPDIAVRSDGQFAVVWDEEDGIDGAVVDENGNASSPIPIVAGGSLPAVGNDHDDLRLAWIDTAPFVHVGSADGFAEVAVDSTLGLASDGVRPAIAVNGIGTAVMWASGGNLVLSQRFTEAANDPSDVTITADAGATRLSLAARPDDTAVWLAGVTAGTQVDTYNVTPAGSSTGALVAQTGEQLSVVAGDVTAPFNLAFRTAAAVKIGVADGTPHTEAGIATSDDLGFGCHRNDCALAFVDPAAAGVLHFERATASSGNNPFTGIANQAPTAAADVALVADSVGDLVAAWIERDVSLGPHAFVGVFDAGGVPQGNAVDLGTADEETPALGVDGVRVVVAVRDEKANNEMRVAEVNVVDGTVGTTISYGDPLRPIRIAVTPVGATDMVLAFVDDSNQARALVGPPANLVETLLTPANSGDAGDDDLALVSLNGAGLFVWVRPDGTLASANVPVDTNPAVVTSSTVHGRAPRMVTRSSDAVVAVFAPAPATSVELFIVDASGTGNAALAVDDTGADAMGLVFDGNLELYLRTLADPARIGVRSIDGNGTITPTTTLQLPAPALSLAAAGGYVAYHRFDAAKLTPRAFLAPVPTP